MQLIAGILSGYLMLPTCFESLQCSKKPLLPLHYWVQNQLNIKHRNQILYEGKRRLPWKHIGFSPVITFWANSSHMLMNSFIVNPFLKKNSLSVERVLSRKNIDLAIFLIVIIKLDFDWKKAELSWIFNFGTGVILLGRVYQWIFFSCSLPSLYPLICVDSVILVYCFKKGVSQDISRSLNSVRKKH